MDLGAFSVSLAVKDIKSSKSFYEKLGFEVFGGDQEQGWLIMRNRDHLVGLFQSGLQENTLTFNPGWDQNACQVERFTDVRDIQRELKSQGLRLAHEADESTIGPEYLVVTDPDGNRILIDQHV